MGRSQRELLLLIWLCMLGLFVTIYLITHKESARNQTLAYIKVHSKEQDSIKKWNDCYPFDSRITAKAIYQDYFLIFENATWQQQLPYYAISYDQLHTLLFGFNTSNVYDEWPNHFRKAPDDSYPHTSLTQSLFTTILNHTDTPISIVVEVGSFMGKSSINIARTIQNNDKSSKFVLLCIDTWLGGLEHWISRKLQRMMGLEYGRPIVYEQFMANVVANNLTRYIIPFSTTSVLGARFLLEKKIFPQIIYIDSAHSQGETYIELELYWTLVQSGGILMGDDWGWSSVRCDVLRFSDINHVNVNVIGSTWYIIKRAS